MTFTLHIWRQKNAAAQGYFEQHQVDACENTSFLEMLDALNDLEFDMEEKRKKKE